MYEHKKTAEHWKTNMWINMTQLLWKLAASGSQALHTCLTSKNVRNFKQLGGRGVCVCFHKLPCSHNPFIHKKFKHHSFSQESIILLTLNIKNLIKIRNYQYFRRMCHPHFQDNICPVVNNVCILLHACSIISWCSRMWVGLERVWWNADGICVDTEQIVAKTFACKVQHLLMADCKYTSLCKYEYIF
jgi:hypothetical protein